MGLDKENGISLYSATGYPVGQFSGQSILPAVPPRLWNSPCTPPDQPGVYAVLEGIESWNHDVQSDWVRYAHWNGLRWSDARSFMTSFTHRRDDYRGHVPRCFNPRQDYPWCEVAA